MPAALVAAAGVLGVIFGLLRIAWIIVASIFLYHVAVETGQFQVMKESIAALSTDKRLQLILIAFCFGAFLEGTGGGGAPVAIAGSFLIGLGFEPFQAATLCLIANTAPVAWGAVGNPIRALATVTGLPEMALSAMTGRILPPLSAILPLWLVRSMVGWRETFEVWPALAVSGLSFALMQFYWSNYQESGLVDIIAALFSLLAMVAFLKVWRPKTSLREHRTNPHWTPRKPRPVDTTRHHSISVSSQGMVALPARLRVHFRVEHAGDQRPAHPDDPETTDALPGSCGPANAARRPRAHTGGGDRRPELRGAARYRRLPGGESWRRLSWA